MLSSSFDQPGSDGTEPSDKNKTNGSGSSRDDASGPEERNLHEHPIIFFDGVCVLCNSFVDFILTRDENQVFRFAPLQGDTAEQLLPEQPNNPDEWTVLYLDQDGLHRRSEASLRILQKLGGCWTVVGGLRYLFPQFFRDVVYRWIARNRYDWFGENDSCRVPTPEEEEQFLP